MKEKVIDIIISPEILFNNTNEASVIIWDHYPHNVITPNGNGIILPITAMYPYSIHFYLQSLEDMPSGYVSENIGQLFTYKLIYIVINYNIHIFAFLYCCNPLHI